MRKKIVIVFVAFSAALLQFAALAEEPLKGAEYGKAEIKTERSAGDKPYWTVVTYPVKTPQEAEYDADKSGTLEPSETREYLKHKYDRIFNYQETGVDSDILREYDADGNGTIDPREVMELRKDLGY